ncbi:hypothetical protein KC19_2G050700 [Ceratodon purpureus]|uniref:AtTam37 zinc finger domain-containing protein n=1 Tax=Ceratodon purpureus TaxID=3225 RepID=A0A8T0IQB4_CERPU|nr:hypothetical protein KC19_2G050700 [Ceratodon purpureus]
MNKVDIGRVLAVVKQRSGEFVGAVKDTAVEFSWDLRDAAEAGFGVPKLISSVASLSVAVVAASGTAAVMFDGAGKVFGKRECIECNGWEGLRCTMCEGKGLVHYFVNNIEDGQSDSVQSLAAAISSGNASFGYVPATMNSGHPLPRRECPTCDGTGVITCKKCKGESWKPKLNLDDIMDVPWKAWNVYRKITPPTESEDKLMANPDLARWMMFDKPAIEDGIEYDEDVKEKMWLEYKEKRSYDELREKVERREPGWEVFQQGLMNINPDRARVDPLVVQNVPYYKAQLQVQAEIDQLQPPPRPANWGDLKMPLSEADWKKEDLKDPRVREEMETLLRTQEGIYGALLDSAWEKQWRDQQFEAISKAKIEAYLQAKQEEGRNPRPSPVPSKDEGAGKSSPATTARDSKASAQKGGGKKAPDDKKKRERQERAERLARQAAEREAALAKSKAARGTRS